MREKAESILAEAAQTNSTAFSDLARVHSDDPATRLQGGDCGWLTQNQSYGSWPPNLIDAIFALGVPGELTPLLETAEGLFIFKLIERKPAEVQPLERVRDAVAYHCQQAWKERTAAEFEKTLRAGLHIEVNEELFDSILPETSQTAQNDPPAPPRLPAR